MKFKSKISFKNLSVDCCRDKRYISNYPSGNSKNIQEL